jgi:stearoyl-CoA desaturase (delta-9 desaturase)
MLHQRLLLEFHHCGGTATSGEIMRSFTAYKAVVLVVVVVPFLATGLAIDLLWARAVHWPDLALLLTMYALVAFGVTVGYHRMLTHRSLSPHPIVKCLLLLLGSMAVEGSALQWAATHIKHHTLSDREGDPHSPVDGFLSRAYRVDVW